MGEKIKDLVNTTFRNKNIAIEINKSSAGLKEEEIHIQLDDMRLEMKKSDFITMGFAILEARKNLLKLKGINNEQ